MSCYHWELEALIEGILLRELDFREILAVNAFNQRYVDNAKKPQMNKILNKPKEERKIINIFAHHHPIHKRNMTGKNFAERQRELALRLAKGGK